MYVKRMELINNNALIIYLVNSVLKIIKILK